MDRIKKENVQMTAQKSSGFVLAVDVGSTNITCHVFDNSGISKYGAIRKVCSTPFTHVMDQINIYE